MKLVSRIIRRDEEALAQAFQSAKQHLEEETSQLLELKSYYAGYVDMFSVKTHNLRAQEISQSRQLLARLSQALSIKEQHILKAKESVARAKLQWQESHLKRCSIDDLVERCEQEERSKNDVKEQKIMDEWIVSARAKR